MMETGHYAVARYLTAATFIFSVVFASCPRALYLYPPLRLLFASYLLQFKLYDLLIYNVYYSLHLSTFIRFSTVDFTSYVGLYGQILTRYILYVNFMICLTL